jgi:hypothetical protein
VIGSAINSSFFLTKGIGKENGLNLVFLEGEIMYFEWGFSLNPSRRDNHVVYGSPKGIAEMLLEKVLIFLCFRVR